MARNYKRDRKGRFARVHSAAGRSLARRANKKRAASRRSGSSTPGMSGMKRPAPKSTNQIQQQVRKGRKTAVKIAAAGAVGMYGAAIAIDQAGRRSITDEQILAGMRASWDAAGRAHTQNALKGLRVARQNRRGVYNITTL